VLKEKSKYILLFLLIVTLGIVGYYIFQQGQSKISSCIAKDYLGTYDEEADVAIFEGEEFEVPQLAQGPTEEDVLGVANPNEKWIEVDLSEQRLRAWDGNSLFLETPISTGLPWWPTPEGEFRIWIKLRYTNMEGGEGRYYYNLPNVPFVMFFENEQVPGWRGYGLHGTYWHNAFGTRRSHGCVNLPTEIAGRLFYWTTPTLKENAWTAFSTADNPGTRIIIHE
jgi:lipoprotein-anchoring transpeptidase ErfK/SrfK